MMCRGVLYVWTRQTYVCICYVFFVCLGPFVFYRRKSSFVQRLSSNLDVNGLAVCNNRVFVIGIASPTIEVFDAVSYRQLQTLTVHAMIDPWDIAARPASPYLYVFEGMYQVLRIDLNGQIVTRWTLDGSQCSLSVSRRNSVVITFSDRLDEFDSVGKILRSIKLGGIICHASHSLSVDVDNFVVCHGLSSDQCTIFHRLRLVDSDSRILDRNRDFRGFMYQPLHMAVADHGCVLVADMHNRRVQIFSDNLSRSIDVISTRREQAWPLRVCYDSPRGNVYISTLNGKVLVYYARTRTSPQCECLDVHSGLIPDHLIDMDYDSGTEED